MDTVNHNREDPSRRPKQAGTPNSRNQTEEPAKRRPPEEKAPQRRAAPEGGTREPQKRRPVPEENSAPRRRSSPESQAAPQRSRPEAGEQPPKAANPQRQSTGTQSKQSAENPRRPGQKKPAPARKSAAGQTRDQAKAGQTRKSARRSETPDDLSSKKRAYGNSKPKKKSAFAVLSQAVSATAKESAQRRRERQERQGKRSKGDKQPLPAVIYTQPQAFNRDRLLVQLVTVTAVVVAFVVGLSVFFEVKHIRVSGAEVYTAWAVQEASGIKEGDNLLTFSRARAGAQIKANLPYVENVSFGIRLPDTVNIIIEEEDVVYAIKDQDEQWWLINSEGRVVDQAKKGQASNYTQITGVAIDHPLRDQTAVAVEAQIIAPVEGTDPTEETTEPVMQVATVSGAEKLSIALQIVRALEDNDIVGDAASINVAQTQSITMWYGTRYQINLGDSANLEYKIACMNSVIMKMQEYESGVLDCSFTIWPDQVSYTPFS